MTTPKPIAQRFEELIETRSIEPYFQPIISFANRNTVGFELLARGTQIGLQTPAEMFAAADYLNRGSELSELCRVIGTEVAEQLPKHAILFVNTHPTESLLTGVLPSLRRMRQQIPDRAIAVEIHEAAVNDAETMTEFRAVTARLNVEIAFDDFGVGRARMLDLLETPPDIVKVDASLIRGLGRKSRVYREFLKGMIATIRKLGCLTLAEAVETEYEADICDILGFDLAQGFYFGHPSPIEKWNPPTHKSDQL